MEADKVLLVDDDETLLYMMAGHLKRQGYRVESTANPLKALDVLQTAGPFAVLVTDLMMPEMDGLELLRQARHIDPCLEIIVITAAASVESAIAAMREDGAYNYLMKPLENISELSLAVNRAATYRRLQLEREALQARALAEADRLQSLITHIGDALLSGDAQNILTVVNPTAARLLSRDDLVGQDALTALPRPLGTLLSNWHTAGDQRPAVVEISWPDNAAQLVTLTPITNGLGNFAGWVMVVRDVTHLKRLDDVRMQMLIETANRIRLPLAQAMNLLTKLSTPIGLPAERASDTVYQLLRIWKRIQEWSDDLLELVQYESSLRATGVSVNPAQVLNDAIAGLSEDLARTIRLEVNLPADLAAVRAEPAMLRKALQRLITRALSRSEADSPIHIAAHQQEWQIWIDISDSGAPIAEPDLPHVFERSFVGAGGSYDSTGLELALAKTIIDRLGGQVWVRNSGAGGSTITICLPTLAVESAVPQAK